MKNKLACLLLIFVLLVSFSCCKFSKKESGVPMETKESQKNVEKFYKTRIVGVSNEGIVQAVPETEKEQLGYDIPEKLIIEFNGTSYDLSYKETYNIYPWDPYSELRYETLDENGFAVVFHVNANDLSIKRYSHVISPQLHYALEPLQNPDEETEKIVYSLLSEYVDLSQYELWMEKVPMNMTVDGIPETGWMYTYNFMRMLGGYPTCESGAVQISDRGHIFSFALHNPGKMENMDPSMINEETIEVSSKKAVKDFFVEKGVKVSIQDSLMGRLSYTKDGKLAVYSAVEVMLDNGCKSVVYTVSVIE